jgi:hypothetical protein
MEPANSSKQEKTGPGLDGYCGRPDTAVADLALHFCCNLTAGVAEAPQPSRTSRRRRRIGSRHRPDYSLSRFAARHHGVKVLNRPMKEPPTCQPARQ